MRQKLRATHATKSIQIKGEPGGYREHDIKGSAKTYAGKLHIQNLTKRDIYWRVVSMRAK